MPTNVAAMYLKFTEISFRGWTFTRTPEGTDEVAITDLGEGLSNEHLQFTDGKLRGIDRRHIDHAGIVVDGQVTAQLAMAATV